MMENDNYQEQQPQQEPPVQENPQQDMQPPYGQPPKPADGMAIASLVCGIMALVMLFFAGTIWMGIIGIVLAIVGIVLGVTSAKATGSGLAKAGFICSIVALGLTVIFTIACAACLCAVGNFALGAAEGMKDAMGSFTLY